MTIETQSEYRIRKAEPREVLPSIDLLPPVYHKGRQLDMAVFSTGSYNTNRAEMSKQRWYSSSLPRISFTPATTSESISAAADNFETEAKPKILDSRWLQVGYIVKIQDGFFTNIQITDEKSLKKLLDRSKKVNGIYLLDNEVGFAPYETFKQGLQDSGDFAKSGLARVLEHTDQKTAPNLRGMSSSKNYKNGVKVSGFDSVANPVLSVAGLLSYRDFDNVRLYVDGDGWAGNSSGGAFGVLE